MGINPSISIAYIVHFFNLFLSIQKKREEEFDVDVGVGIDVGQGYALDVAFALGVDVALVLVLGIVEKTDFLRIVRAPCILLLSNMKGAIRWKEY